MMFEECSQWDLSFDGRAVGRITKVGEADYKATHNYSQWAHHFHSKDEAIEYLKGKNRWLKDA